MCCCVSCDACGGCIGHILYALEKLASCCAMTAVVTCLVATLILMLGLGVGLGYNYCFVDTKMALVMPTKREGLDPADKPPVFRHALGSRPTTTASFPTTVSDQAFTKIGNFHNYYQYNGRRSIDNGKYSILQNNTGFELAPESFVKDGSVREPAIVVPLSKVDLLSLITKLKENKRNITLKLVA